MTEVEFLPLWYRRKRRRQARIVRVCLVVALPLLAVAAWLWLA